MSAFRDGLEAVDASAGFIWLVVAFSEYLEDAYGVAVHGRIFAGDQLSEREGGL